jgi:hypothetical protein
VLLDDIHACFSKNAIEIWMAGIKTAAFWPLTSYTEVYGLIQTGNDGNVPLYGNNAGTGIHNLISVFSRNKRVRGP